MSIGSDSTQYVTPSPRCDPSMSQRLPGGFALQNAKSKITTTWSSWTRRVMATDAVRQTSSNSLWFATIFQYTQMASKYVKWHTSTPYLNVSQRLA